MIWYLENLPRNRFERVTLESLVLTVDWLIPIRWRIDDSTRLVWDADIYVSEDKYPISLCYPNHFPYSPPSVIPRSKTERWSQHQYGECGELCLEYGPDNWYQALTGADMIQSAYRLLKSEKSKSNEQSHVTSRHDTTLGQDLRGSKIRLLITHDLNDFIMSISEGEIITGKLFVLRQNNSLVYVIESIISPENKKWHDTTIPKPIIKEGFDNPITLIRWPLQSKLPSSKSVTGFRKAVISEGFEIPDTQYVLLVHGSKMHVYLLFEDDDSIGSIPILPPQPVTTRLDKDHSSLMIRKVAIVGCGSLGSKFAIMLARSGIGKFLLVDDDIIFPDNFVRHDLDWRDTGTHKVDSVSRRIELVNPAAICEKAKHKLGGQEASGSIETLIELIAKCDLIVDATANVKVFNYLCAASEIGKKPFLWAEIFGGGIGGFIARYRPGIEPDPASIRLSIEQWCAEKGKPMERSMNDYESQETGKPLIADDADVTVITAHAARMAIDMLIPRNPSIFPHSIYIIGLAKGWIFNEPFETYPIIAESKSNTIQQTLDPEESKKEIIHILKLYNDYKNANSSTAENNQAPST